MLTKYCERKRELWTFSALEAIARAVTRSYTQERLWLSRTYFFRSKKAHSNVFENTLAGKDNFFESM